MPKGNTEDTASSVGDAKQQSSTTSTSTEESSSNNSLVSNVTQQDGGVGTSTREVTASSIGGGGGGTGQEGTSEYGWKSTVTSFSDNDGQQLANTNNGEERSVMAAASANLDNNNKDDDVTDAGPTTKTERQEEDDSNAAEAPPAQKKQRLEKASSESTTSSEAAAAAEPPSSSQERPAEATTLGEEEAEHMQVEGSKEQEDIPETAMKGHDPSEETSQEESKAVVEETKQEPADDGGEDANMKTEAPETNNNSTSETTPMNGTTSSSTEKPKSETGDSSNKTPPESKPQEERVVEESSGNGDASLEKKVEGENDESAKPSSDSGADNGDDSNMQEDSLETINNDSRGPAPMSVPLQEKVEGENGAAATQKTTEASSGGGDKRKNKPKSKNLQSRHCDPVILETRRRIQISCRDNDLASGMEAYEEALAKNIKLEAQSFYNLLNLCDGLERSVHIGTPKPTTSNSTTEEPKVIRPVDWQTRQKYIFRLKDQMAEMKLALNETAFTAIVKILSRNKEYQMAEDVLGESESVQQCRPKLRLYSTLLTAYCEDCRMEDALKCWRRLTKAGLEITEKEGLSLMRCAKATGDIKVMQRVLTDVAEFVSVPSKDTVAAILEWFESPHALHREIITPKHADDCQVKKLLGEIHESEIEPLPNMGPIVNTKGWRISSAVPIDPKTGILQTGCLKDCKLHPVPLSARAWEEMKQMNETIVFDGQLTGSTSEFQGGRKGKKRMTFCPEKRKGEWKRFNDFLENLSAPLDVVVDGANVGYYKQNFSNSPKHVDYDQIDWIVRHFTKMGKRVLLFLHERHFSSKLMPAEYIPLKEKWEKEGTLYRTPIGMNDDWFWLHAALKYKSLVLTNDEMRDHHFQMLAPRTFLRWKERHQVHFNFGHWDHTNGNTDGGRRREVELVFPHAYSRRIQRVEDGLVVPLAKRGDENRFMDGVHTACDDEPIEETYLCIRPTQEI